MSLSGWLKDYLYIPMGGNRRASWFTAISAGFLLTFVVLLRPGLHVLGDFSPEVSARALAMARIPAFRRWVTTNINIWMTMLLGGLWHGASWNFVIWGGLNGLGITVYKLWRRQPMGSEGPLLEARGGRPDYLPLHHVHPIWFRTASHTTWASFGTEHDLQGNGPQPTLDSSRLGTSTPVAVITDALHHYGHVFAVMALGYVIHLLPSRWKERYRTAFVQAGRLSTNRGGHRGRADRHGGAADGGTPSSTFSSEPVSTGLRQFHPNAVVGTAVLAAPAAAESQTPRTTSSP